jgi:hypothetical protein
MFDHQEDVMRRMYQTPLLLPTFLGLCAVPNVPALSLESRQGEVPKEVQGMVGVYTGSWTMYGVDGKGQVVKRMAWTDTMKADGATVKGDRAYVTTTDEMTFEGGQIPKMKVPGTEGYFLNKDGSLGDYFIETFGQVHRAHKIGKDVWTYASAASPQELAMLGFSNVSVSQHVVVKVVTHDKGIETHHISRVTTVKWKDTAGEERTLQYVSLQGVHKRQAPPAGGQLQ